MANYQKDLTRKRYKEIKTYDHKQMEALLKRIYNEGKNDALELFEKREVRPADIQEAIDGIRGIGAAKIEAIMNAVHELYEKRMQR